MTIIREFGDIVNRAADQVAEVFPWYRRLSAVAGPSKRRDPNRLPLLDDETLAVHYYPSAATGPAGTRVYRTSGTSLGMPKSVLWSEDDHDHYVRHRTQVLANFLGTGMRSACADLGTGHAAASTLEIFERLGLEAFAIDFTRPIGEHLALLNEHRPDVLFTMPMILDRMLVGGALRHRPRKVIVVGDLAPPAWQRGVAEQLGIGPEDVLDVYGSIEIGAIAYYSHRAGSYVFHEHIIPEAIPAAELFAGRAIQGNVLALTSTARTSFPAIRYVTGDLIVGLEHRLVGDRKAWCYTRLDGRLGSELKHGEKISLYSIATAVSTVLPVALWEVEKVEGRLRLLIQSPGFCEEAARRIAGLIREQNPSVDQMIRSGLVGDLEVVAGAVAQSAAQAKRSVRAKPA